MSLDVRPFLRLRRGQKTLFLLVVAFSLIFGLIWKFSLPKSFQKTSGGTFDVFDPVHGIFPGQRHLYGQSPDNVLGLSRREVKLVDRVHDVEDENRMLKHQLSVSQNQLISLMGKHQKPSEKRTDEEYDDNGGEEGHKQPCNNQDQMPKCELIHIAIVCAGYNSTRNVMTLIKSILFYRRHPIHFHFVTDDSSKEIMSTLFQSWMLPQVKVSYYLSESAIGDIAWIPNKHYSGIYGLLKLTLPKLLPDSLSKVIVLDTDLIVATDISRLWQLFTSFQANEALGLVENQSDWYIPGKLWKSHSPWPALGRGFNSGVILMDLVKLRARNWSQMWRLVAEKDLVTMYTTSLADQDIFNGLLKQYPSLLHKLPCQWNLQLSDNTRSELCYSKGVHDLNIIHFNSPKKLDVKNKNVEYFRNHYLTFLQYDGNLLRREMIDCNTTTTSTIATQTKTKESSELETKDDNNEDGSRCYELEKARDRIYRTHPFFLDYDSSSVVNQGEVTLVAQLSMDRLHMIEALCDQWKGPVSVSLYLSDAEADQFVKFALGSPILNQRRNVAYHVIYREGDFYPINYLRNIALKFASTEYVFLSDIDFLPGSDAHKLLKRAAERLLSHQLEQPRALVVPAFETLRYRLDNFPKTKADVVHLLDEGTLVTFRYHVWTKGHDATNYGKWRTATTPYKIKWEPDFEPYILIQRSQVPEYDMRFVGFGWNKVSHIMELDAQDTEFVVLPNVFIVHMPHAPSLDIAKYRSSDQYRKCLKALKLEFIADMETKYGRKYNIS